MRALAQKPKAAKQIASARLAELGRAPFEQSRDASSPFDLQGTIEDQGVQQPLEVNTGDVEGAQTTTEPRRFGHDFSRVPIHAPRPFSTARGQSSSESAMRTPVRALSSRMPQSLGPESGSLASADRPAVRCRPKDPGELDEDKGSEAEEPLRLESPAPAPVPSPTNAPAPKAATVKHVTPTFVLDKKEDPRSNTKPSTQSKSDPTFVGKVVGDGKLWHYELSSVESKGKIRIVYFTDDRYPAPTPTDDSGALSNVTKTNWKTIVDDLEKNKDGIPDFWSAYRAEDVHESYHWEKEWQGEMKKELVKAEDEIALLSLGVDKAPTAPDAEKVLAPQATKVFNDAMARADTSYQALPDSPGAPAFKAQIPVVTALKKRVSDHATTNKW